MSFNSPEYGHDMKCELFCKAQFAINKIRFNKNNRKEAVINFLRINSCQYLFVGKSIEHVGTTIQLISGLEEFG